MSSVKRELRPADERTMSVLAGLFALLGARDVALHLVVVAVLLVVEYEQEEVDDVSAHTNDAEILEKEVEDGGQVNVAEIGHGAEEHLGNERSLVVAE